jgi:hypothetical protein
VLGPLILTVTPLFAADTLSDLDAARAALALAAAEVELARDPYPAAYRRAIAERRPLVVWIRQPVAFQVPGAVSVSVRQFPDTDGPGVVVALPSGQSLRRAAWLPGRPTPARVSAVISAPTTAR